MYTGTDEDTDTDTERDIDTYLIEAFKVKETAGGGNENASRGGASTHALLKEGRPHFRPLAQWAGVQNSRTILLSVTFMSYYTHPEHGHSET